MPKNKGEGIAYSTSLTDKLYVEVAPNMFQLLSVKLDWPMKIIGKGGKNRKRGRNDDQEKEKRELRFKEYLQG